jgi:3-oxoacyl-(acyl-carrier-protein) synthase
MAVLVAGCGAVCAAGNGVAAGYAAIKRGVDSLTPRHFPDLQLARPPLCAAVDDDLSLLAGREGLYRTLALAMVAANEAMADIPRDAALSIGIVAATTVGGICQTESHYKAYRSNHAHLPVLAIESAVHEPAVLSAELCRIFNGSGFHTVSTACSSSLHAIGMAKRLIERNYYDACLVVGADALCVTTVRGFGSLTLLDPSGCRPFDRNRAGISIGEGAGALLLVSPLVQKRYRLPVHAEINGWGASSDCHHMTAPHPEGRGALQAIQSALAEANLAPNAIDGIVAHGTGTPDNDKTEIAALRTLFGTLPPFCSMKRTLGHTLAASGILEAVFAIEMLRESFFPPTAGFEEIDPDIGAAPSPAGKRPLSHILKNAFGFGGNNGAIVLSFAGGAA